jgi:phosphoglycerol transferase
MPTAASLRRGLPYFATGLLTLTAFALVTRLWNASLLVPFNYADYGDALGSPRILKTMLDGGWVYWNPLLAYPFGQNSSDVPQLAVWHLIVQRMVLPLCGNNPFLALNLFYIALPIANALAALFVLRRLGVAALAAVACAVLYGNLYAVYWRGESHLYYAALYVVPFACYAAIAIARGAPIVWAGTRRDRVEAALLLGTAFVLGLENIYHAFFASAIVCAAMLMGVLRTRSGRAVLEGLTFLAAVGLGAIVNAAPTLWWHITAGASDILSFTRSTQDALLYSLSLAQLVLPIPNHRLATFAHWRAEYGAVLPSMINENASATLGAFGTLGLIVLFAVLAMNYGRRAPRDLDAAAFLCTAAIALATFGGIGALFNVFVFDEVRAYNRIISFVAFFCLFATASVLAPALQRLRRVSGGPQLAIAAALIVAVAGVLDETPAHVFPFANDRTAFAADAAWTAKLEAAVPAGGAVLQLPYVSCPLLPTIAGLDWDPQSEDVEYLHTSRIRWSFCSTEGREGARFERWLATLPPARQAAAALLAGFDGVLIYRGAYFDRGAALSARYRALLHEAPLERAEAGDGAETFFSFAPAAARAKAIDPDVGTARGIAAVVQQTGFHFGRGFSIDETGAGIEWHWADRVAELVFQNDARTPVDGRLSFDLEALGANTVVTVSGAGLNEPLATPRRVHVERQLRLPPGETVVRFTSSVPDTPVLPDPRQINFRLVDLRFVAAEQTALEARLDRLERGIMAAQR